MRSLFLFIAFVCALGAASIGCGNGASSDEDGGAGSGGSAGSGGRAGTGGSVGSGGIAPVIEKIEWEWKQPCTFGQPGQNVVTITATDADTQVSQLTYSGDIDQCGSINARVTTLMCDDHPGLRGGDVTVTDPQGNKDSLFFAFDPCSDGCEGDACQ